MIRVNQDGTGREVYTVGIRNSVGHDFHPETGELWFTDNQVDGMGDDQPPGEINRQTAPGQHFGFPWYGGGDVRTNEYKDQEPPADIVMPVVETDAHAADLGMHFYTGDMFPAEYKNAIFSAQHGSWNRTVPVGARVMVTKIAEDGTATTEPFAEGWLDDGDRRVQRPAGRRGAAARRLDPRLRRPRRARSTASGTRRPAADARRADPRPRRAACSPGPPRRRTSRPGARSRACAAPATASTASR